jgi:hypothetical protein
LASGGEGTDFACEKRGSSFCQNGGRGGRTRTAIRKRLEFPENRENNREFLKFPAIPALSAGFWRPFALQFQGSTDDYLFGMEQRICFAGTRNSSAGAGELPYLDTDLPSPSLEFSPLNCTPLFIPQNCESVEFPMSFFRYTIAG